LYYLSICQEVLSKIMKKLVMTADEQIWTLSDFILGLKLPNTKLEQQLLDHKSTVKDRTVYTHVSC